MGSAMPKAAAKSNMSLSGVHHAGMSSYVMKGIPKAYPYGHGFSQMARKVFYPPGMATPGTTPSGLFLITTPTNKVRLQDEGTERYSSFFDMLQFVEMFLRIEGAQRNSTVLGGILKIRPVIGHLGEYFASKLRVVKSEVMTTHRSGRFLQGLLQPTVQVQLEVLLGSVSENACVETMLKQQWGAVEIC
eukprot:IDg1488t1